MREARTARAGRGWVVTLVIWGLSCSSTPSSVERIENGRSYHGRYIQGTSYAWYARGAHLEARGQLRDAETAFVEAVKRDPESGSLWARIGAVRCQRGEGDHAEAFERAWATRNDRSLVLIEKGKCALRSKAFELALEHGKAAVQLSPESIDASFLVVDALFALGRDDEAVRWLDALAAFSPGAHRVQSRRIDEARLRRDPSRERRAREQRGFSLLDPNASQSDDGEAHILGKASIDQALTSRDLELALGRAAILGVGLTEVALRAVALGKPDLGKQLARLVLDADPTNANAQVALLAATDLLGDRSTPIPEPPDPSAGAHLLHPLAVLLFADLLERRVGPEASEVWSKSHRVSPSLDPLVERMRTRRNAESVTAR